MDAIGGFYERGELNEKKRMEAGKVGKRPYYRAPDGMPGIRGMAIHTAGAGYQNLRLYSTGRGHPLERML